MNAFRGRPTVETGYSPSLRGCASAPHGVSVAGW